MLCKISSRFLYDLWHEQKYSKMFVRMSEFEGWKRVKCVNVWKMEIEMVLFSFSGQGPAHLHLVRQLPHPRRQGLRREGLGNTAR